jgi:hypothetical protein
VVTSSKVLHSRVWFCNAGCDPGWTWGGTLPHRLQALIDELAWHFCFAAEPDDLVLFAKPWPAGWYEHLIALGLSPPHIGVLPELKSPSSAHLEPFAWDNLAEELAKTHFPAATFPDPRSVKRANGRVFSLSLEQEWPATFSGWESQLGPVLRASDHPSDPLGLSLRDRLKTLGWSKALLKGEHGQSGNANVAISLDNPDSWKKAQGILRRCGSAVLEPWHFITTEYGWLYHVDPKGKVEGGHGHRLWTDNQGGYRGIVLQPEGKLPVSITSAFGQATQKVAFGLHALGYYGPVGQDGYCHRMPEGERFRPLSDLNARHTMARAGHGLLRRLGNRYLALGFAHTRRQSLPWGNEARDGLFSDMKYDPVNRRGATWLTPGQDAAGNVALRQSWMAAADSEKELECLVKEIEAKWKS